MEGYNSRSKTYIVQKVKSEEYTSLNGYMKSHPEFAHGDHLCRRIVDVDALCEKVRAICKVKETTV